VCVCVWGGGGVRRQGGAVSLPMVRPVVWREGGMEGVLMALVEVGDGDAEGVDGDVMVAPPLTAICPDHHDDSFHCSLSLSLSLSLNITGPYNHHDGSSPFFFSVQ